MAETSFEHRGDDDLLDAGRIVLDEAGERLVVDGETVPLPRKRFRLLLELMRHPGKLVSKADIMDSVWDGRPHSDAVITTAVKEIRQALNDNPRKPWAIETVHGRGYRFLLDVTVRPAATATSTSTATATPERPIQSRRRHASRWLIVAGGALLIAIAVYLTRASGYPLRSVGVLPLDDMTVNGDHRWFAEGMTEELLNGLIRVPNLDVAARNSAARFANSDKTVSEIGDILNVSHMIEGSIRDAGNGKIRLTVQLIRSSDGFHEWSHTWDRSLTFADALDIQRDVSESVVSLMQGEREMPPADTRGQSVADDVWEKLLRGRELVDRRTVEGINEGLALLREAVAMAPDYAQAHAALASAYLYAAASMQRPLDESIAIASRHVTRALELDPDSVEALVAASFAELAEGDAESSLVFADHALEITPAYAGAHQRRAVALANLGRLEEAYAALVRARQLDPLTPVILTNLSNLALNTGRIDEAIEVGMTNVRWNPTDHMALGGMGWILMEVGRYEQALACLRSSLAASPRHPLTASRLGELYWRIGADEQAASVAVGLPGWGSRAAVLVAHGEMDSAIEETKGIPFRGDSGITPLDIYYWAGDSELAPESASGFIEYVGGLDRLASAKLIPDNATTAYIVLEAADDTAAGELGTLLDQRYADNAPAEIPVFRHMLPGAMWHAWRGDREATLAWLAAMADAGMVVREIEFDPVFAWLRSDPELIRLNEQMRQRADAVRETLGANANCGGPQ